MKILTNEQYDKLVAKGLKDVDSTKAATIKTLREQLRKQRDQTGETIDRYEDSIAKREKGYIKEVEALKEAHEAAMHKLNKKVAVLEEENNAYKELSLKSSELSKKSIELTLKDDIITAKVSAHDTIQKEMEALAKKAEEARAEGVKTGYADGVADGIREASKITAEDRKMAMQVALMSAASHTPDAAKELTKGVLKATENALPATTKKR